MIWAVDKKDECHERTFAGFITAKSLYEAHQLVVGTPFSLYGIPFSVNANTGFWRTTEWGR